MAETKTDRKEYSRQYYIKNRDKLKREAKLYQDRIWRRKYRLDQYKSKVKPATVKDTETTHTYTMGELLKMKTAEKFAQAVNMILIGSAYYRATVIQKKHQARKHTRQRIPTEITDHNKRAVAIFKR